MNFRRYYLPNTIVFITNVVHQRAPIFANETYLELFRKTLRNVKQLYPFQMIAYVFLPDHMHLMIRPLETSNFSQIMKSVKGNFTYAYKQKTGISGSLKFWQKRFYDHLIRDETDFANHLHYLHYNPVKHGYVNRPEDWPHSSFLSWKQRGVYSERWGWSLPDEVATFDMEVE